jgi:hypothetical protein
MFFLFTGIEIDQLLAELAISYSEIPIEKRSRRTIKGIKQQVQKLHIKPHISTHFRRPHKLNKKINKTNISTSYSYPSNS